MHKPKSPPAVPVLTSSVTVRDLPIYVESIGLLEPIQQVDIRPQVSGIVQEVHFKEGNQVVPGTPLLTIESESYAIQLMEAEAALAQQRSSLENAMRKKARYQELANKKLISAQEWDELSAQESLQRAQVRAAEARVATAQINLKRCVITAPIKGMSGKLSCCVGSYLSAAQPAAVVSVINSELLLVDFALTESEFRQLTAMESGKCRVEVESITPGGPKTTAELSFVGSSFDAHTGLIQLRGQLDNAAHQFTPGQYVRVKVAVEMLHNVAIVPQRAIKINQQGSYLFVVKENSTADMRMVTTGRETDGGMIVVTAGIAPGERVITEGHLRLAPGMPVIVKDDATADAEPATPTKL
jgi:multidrug efflux system membrane fusion protein